MGVLGIYWGVSGLRKERNSAEKQKNHTSTGMAAIKTDDLTSLAALHLQF